MEQIIISGILAFVLTFYAIPIIIMVANANGIYDHPDYERKLHSHPIPSIGGLAIFGGFMVAVLVMANINAVVGSFQYIMATFVIIFFVGVKDDVLMITPMKKLMGQLIVAAILMFKANLLITNMHGFLSITTIDPAFSYFLSLITLIVVMNAFNLIDGVDGLAAIISIISVSFLSAFFIMNGDLFFALMGFTFVASLIAFLIYNFAPARIFMGDGGSMLSGLVNAILVIRFIETAENSHILPVLASPAMGFGILAIPLLDTLRVFGIRILHGRSPFSPDNNHLHHVLLDKGFSHTAVTLMMGASSVLITVITYLILPIGTTKVILLLIVSFFTSVYFIFHAKPRIAKLTVVKGEKLMEDANLKKVRNFVSFLNDKGKIADKD